MDMRRYSVKGMVLRQFSLGRIDGLQKSDSFGLEWGIIYQKRNGLIQGLIIEIEARKWLQFVKYWFTG